MPDYDMPDLIRDQLTGIYVSARSLLDECRG
jgi:hypothetical protein